MSGIHVGHKCQHETVSDVIDFASGEGAIRRSASGQWCEAFLGGRIFLKFSNAGADESPADAPRARLRMSPLRGRHRAAAIVVAAARIVNREPRGIHDGRAVARMRCLADTAGMRLLRHGRQRQRDETPHDGEQQQKSGSQTMHVSVAPVLAGLRERSRSRVRIQTPKRRQA